MLHLYPFQGRLLLYLVPIISLLIALGAWRIYSAIAATLPLAGPAFLIILIGPILGMGAAQLAKWRPYNNGLANLRHEDIKPVMAHIKANWCPGDVVYLYRGTGVPFNYYAKQFGFESSDTIAGIHTERRLRDWSVVQADLRKLDGRRRVWILFSHVMRNGGIDEEKLYLYILDQMGRRLDSYRPEPLSDASVHLYDLHPAVGEKSSNVQSSP